MPQERQKKIIDPAAALQMQEKFYRKIMNMFVAVIYYDAKDGTYEVLKECQPLHNKLPAGKYDCVRPVVCGCKGSGGGLHFPGRAADPAAVRTGRQHGIHECCGRKSTGAYAYQYGDQGGRCKKLHDCLSGYL